MTEPRLITADAIAPMDPALPPVLLNAGMVITGDTITAIGERSDLRRTYGDLPALREHFAGLLTPGLINAHTHLELSHFSATDPLPFPAWVERMIAQTPQDPTELEQFTHTAFSQGLRQSLSCGVTTVGDISRHIAITRAAYMAFPSPKPRLVSFAEIVGIGAMRHRCQTLLDAATHPADLHSPHFHAGLSPHAPYTVEGRTLHAVLQKAIVHNLPLCMHLAEHAEEARFLRDLSGPLGRDWPLMQRLNILTNDIATYDGGPIRWAQLHGLLVNEARPFPTLLAHANHLDDNELSLLAHSDASVAYCPRTHAFFGHPPHRYPYMQNNGINVCLGTDSLASSPDLSPLQEAKLLTTRDEFDPYLALEMITRNAAFALGMGNFIGSLSPRKQADFCLFPLALPADAPRVVDLLVHTAPQPSAVFIGGQPASLLQH